MNAKTSALYFEFFTEVGIINQLSRARADRHLPDSLTMSHFSVLNHLTRVNDGQTPLRMARAFQIPKTTITHTLAGLEAHGYIEMRPNPSDGRSKCVWLTDAGRDYRERAIASIAPGFLALADEVKPKTIEKLIPTLTKIRQFLDAQRDDE